MDDSIGLDLVGNENCPLRHQLACCFQGRHRDLSCGFTDAHLVRLVVQLVLLLFSIVRDPA